MDAQKCQRKLGKQEHFRILVGMAVEEIDLKPFPIKNDRPGDDGTLRSV